MAISHERILQEVFGRATNIPVDLDQEPWSGYVDNATRRVDEIRKWYVKDVGDTYIGGSDTDPVWSELVELEVIDRLLRQFRSVQDADTFRKTAIASLLGQIVSTVAHEDDWDSTSTPTTSLTIAGIRKSVLGILIRQPTPVFPSINVLDKAILEEHVMLWDSRKWRWRRKAIKIQIGTDGSVSAATDTPGIDGFATKIIYIKDSNNSVSEIHWKDSTRWAELMAHFDGEPTGKPKYFYLQPGGSTIGISWLPEPDKAYDGFCTIYSRCSGLDGESPLSDLPHSFRMHLRDRIVARMLMLFGDNADARIWASKVEKDYQSLLAEFDDTGSNEWNAAYHKPARFQKDFRSFNGRFFGGMG